jgi:hypothetical protein
MNFFLDQLRVAVSALSVEALRDWSWIILCSYERCCHSLYSKIGHVLASYSVLSPTKLNIMVMSKGGLR